MEPQTHILVVEDEAALQQVLAYNLERAGFAVEQAFDADEALTLIADDDHGSRLQVIQNELFDLGADIATPGEVEGALRIVAGQVDTLPPPDAAEMLI